jgi:Ser/Thr protein kinase RdoA (MazF antagonist)
MTLELPDFPHYLSPQAQGAQSQNNDVVDIIEAMRVGLGIDLDQVRPVEEGQGRTFLARSGGEEVVVKWGLDIDLAEKIPYVAAQVSELRDRGCRVPTILRHGGVGERAYAWVQERLPGSPATVMDEALLDDLLALVARLAEAPVGPHRTQMAFWVPAVVFEDLAGWWRTAEAMSPEATAVCRRLRSWIEGTELLEARHDYVHSDLNPSNLRVLGGRLAGVIDIENLGVGDSSVDIARLAFEWFRQARDQTPGLAPDGLERLTAAALQTGGEAGWRVAVAYELISQLGWRSEHLMPHDPRTLVAVSSEFLDVLSS